MILPSGISTTDYSRLANSKGWSSGWPSCAAINGGQIVKINLTRSGTSIAGGVHRNIAELFLLIGNEIERRGYMFHPGWCWGAECRQISGTNTPSNHSWGLAVDINAPNNPYTSSGQHDIPDWAFALFRSYGFGVGADYSGKKDWMHVEAMGTVADMAAMTALARKNIGGGGGVVIVPPIDPPNTDEDAWLTVGAKEDIIQHMEYGFDKVMAGKGGEPPDHNIAQVKAAVAELTNIVKGMYNTMVPPEFQGQGAHDYRAETAWATDKVIVPKLDAILAALGTPPAGPSTYTVVSGDTLSGIAVKTGKSVADLQAWNGITDPNSINIGQVLKLGPQ